MSERYVWEKCGIYRAWVSGQSYEYYPIPHSNPSGQTQWNAGYVGASLAADDGSSSALDSGSTVNIPGRSVLLAQKQTPITSANKMYTPYESGNEEVANAGSFQTDCGFAWYVTQNAMGAGWALTCVNVSTNKNGKVYTYILKKYKGSSLGYVSDASNDQYPTISGGGISGDYWYIYKGSDTIDPTAISYPTAQLRPGDSLTVAVSPRTPTYGGTISYLYQYRVNGGAWTDIQTTTAASISFTVPASAKSIQFRARAQDDMGFTSTTYVTGAAVTLERLNLWVGVNGKARKGMELYVGVNGKARKVTAAYIGVNGKARRFL